MDVFEICGMRSFCGDQTWLGNIPSANQRWLAGCNGSMDNPRNSIVGIPAWFDDTGGWMEVSSWEGVATG